MPVPTVTLTSPLASSTVSATVATEYVLEVSPLAKVRVFEPSLDEATKSLPEASATVRAMVRPPSGAAVDSSTVNDAAVPSVTGEVPALMVAAGASSSLTVTEAEDGLPTV